MTISPIDKTGSIVWEGGLLFESSVDIVNIGNSPAISVTYFGKIIFPENVPIPISKKVKDACVSDDTVGGLIFPREKINDWFGDTMTMAQVISRLIYARKIHGITGQGFFFDVAFCVDYRINGDPSVHHTSKLYMVGLPENRVPIAGQDVPKGGIELMSDAHGDYAD